MQVVVFDLEFGQPAASSSLNSNRAPFRDILGCFGHQAIGKDVARGGIDLLYCSHQVCALLLTPTTTADSAAPTQLLLLTAMRNNLRAVLATSSVAVGQHPGQEIEGGILL